LIAVYPTVPIKVGPFDVRCSRMPDGWTRYALVIDDDRELRSWLSMPCVNDCRDAVMRDQAKRGPNARTVQLLLESADLAKSEARRIKSLVNGEPKPKETENDISRPSHVKKYSRYY
jgi:hypothetical protein